MYDYTHHIHKLTINKCNYQEMETYCKAWNQAWNSTKPQTLSLSRQTGTFNLLTDVNAAGTESLKTSKI